MELLAVIAIIGIMSAVGFVSLNSNKTNTKLQTAQREVSSIIRLTQSYALQGKAQGGNTPCGYGFRFTSASGYEIFYNSASDLGVACDTGNASPANRQFIVSTSQTAETGSLKNNVTLSGVADYTTTEIYWTMPFGNMFNGTGAVFAADKIFILSLSGNNKTVTVSPGGGIAEN